MHVLESLGLQPVFLRRLFLLSIGARNPRAVKETTHSRRLQCATASIQAEDRQRRRWTTPPCFPPLPVGLHFLCQIRGDFDPLFELLHPRRQILLRLCHRRLGKSAVASAGRSTRRKHSSSHSLTSRRAAPSASRRLARPLGGRGGQLLDIESIERQARRRAGDIGRNRGSRPAQQSVQGVMHVRQYAESDAVSF